MTSPDATRAEHIAAYAIRQRTRAVGWLIVTALSIPALMASGAMGQSADISAATVGTAVVLLLAGVTSLLLWGSAILAAWAGWRYTQARSALKREVLT